MAYRHCSGCGRAFDQKTWQRESFCGSCGESLKRGLQRDEPLELHPYPDQAPPPGPDGRKIDCVLTLRKLAKQHPWIFSAGAIGVGVGAVMLAPQVLLIGQAAMAIGAILMCCGMAGSVYAEPGDDAGLISAGWLLFLGGVALALLACLLTTAGIVAVVAGSGVATKASVELILRKRIEQQLRSKNVTELLTLSRQLN